MGIGEVVHANRNHHTGTEETSSGGFLLDILGGGAGTGLGNGRHLEVERGVSNEPKCSIVRVLDFLSRGGSVGLVPFGCRSRR